MWRVDKHEGPKFESSHYEQVVVFISEGTLTAKPSHSALECGIEYQFFDIYLIE